MIDLLFTTNRRHICHLCSVIYIYLPFISDIKQSLRANGLEHYYCDENIMPKYYYLMNL